MPTRLDGPVYEQHKVVINNKAIPDAEVFDSLTIARNFTTQGLEIVFHFGNFRFTVQLDNNYSNMTFPDIFPALPELSAGWWNVLILSTIHQVLTMRRDILEGEQTHTLEHQVEPEPDKAKGGTIRGPLGLAKIGPRVLSPGHLFSDLQALICWIFFKVDLPWVVNKDWEEGTNFKTYNAGSVHVLQALRTLFPDTIKVDPNGKTITTHHPYYQTALDTQKSRLLARRVKKNQVQSPPASNTIGASIQAQDEENAGELSILRLMYILESCREEIITHIKTNSRTLTHEFNYPEWLTGGE
ncbi:MAG: hypothetical protein ACOCXT_04105 [Candidatus Dojkabacteria bacterium]